MNQSVVSPELARAYQLFVKQDAQRDARNARLIRQAPVLDDLVPAGAGHSAWDGANGSVGMQPAPWRADLLVPAYALDIHPPRSLRLHRLAPDDDEHTRAPVLPSIFMPGFPKSATSWLYNCMMGTWGAQRVCGRGGGTPEGRWTSAACKRRFLLPALAWGAAPRLDVRNAHPHHMPHSSHHDLG